MSRATVAAVTAVIAGLAGPLAACRGELGATEIVVTIDTTFGVPCTIDRLHIEVTSDGDPVTTDIAVTDADLPGSIVLVPRGDPTSTTVTVTGMRAGEPFAIARDAVRFVNEGSVELRFVLDRSCVPGPCPATGIGGYRALPKRQGRRGCGERGYTWKNANFVMRDACAMPEASVGTVLRDVDEQEAASPLTPGVPFPFRFYAKPVTQIWAGTNGYLGFGDAMPNALTGSVGASRSLGVPGFPGQGVLAFWDDLRTGAAGVCFTVSGTFPDRMLWVTWKEACFASPGKTCKAAPEQGTLTFGIALEETTDRLYIGYRSMVSTGNPDRAKGQTATIGVTDAVPRGCVAAQCSVDGVCQDGTPCGYTEFLDRRIIDPLPTLELDPR